MTKPNKTVFIGIKMSEEQVSELDSMLMRGETRSAAIRRLLSDAWVDMMMKRDKENGFNVTDYLPPNI